MYWPRQADVALRKHVPVLRSLAARMENVFVTEAAVQMIIVVVLKKNATRNVTAVSNFFQLTILSR
jgi:hypothetical protein